MAINLGFLIECIVIGLLTVTISYCFVLDRRLRSVKRDEAVMRQTVAELCSATEKAEQAIEGLRGVITDCDRTLLPRLQAAERYSLDLDAQIRSGGDILERISTIVSNAQMAASRPTIPASASASRAASVARSPSPHSALEENYFEEAYLNEEKSQPRRLKDTMAAARALVARVQSQINQEQAG